MASSDGPKEHTEEEGDIKGCKYTTQNTMEIRTLWKQVLINYCSRVYVTEGHTHVLIVRVAEFCSTN